MDPTFMIVVVTAMLVLFAALSAAFGADSRDGFADRPFRATFR